MWYSLIPPALVVLSLVGIIIFLMKKASAVAELGEQLVSQERSEGVVQEKLGGKIKSKGLWLLEKIFHGFRFVFLKLVKTFSLWGESMSRKRNQKKENQNKQAVEGQVEEKTFPEDIEAEKIDEIFRRRERNIKLETDVLSEKIEGKTIVENEIAPKKDIFEKILIERIAANPKDIEAYERLGEYYFEIENWDYAKECFKQVIKLNPGSRNAKTKIRKLERLLSRE